MIVLDNDLNPKAVWDNDRRSVGRLHLAGPASVICTRSNSFPTGNNFDQAAMTGRDLQDGAGWHRARALRQRRDTRSRNSAPCTRWIAGIQTKCTSRRSPSGACRSSRCTRRPRAQPVDGREATMKRIALVPAREPARSPAARRSSLNRFPTSASTPTPICISLPAYSARSRASPPIHAVMCSFTREPATRSPRSATSGRSITVAHGSFSSIRPGSS